METQGGEKKEGWKKDGRSDVVMVDIETPVPKDHLLRKIERVMDCDWLYERLSHYLGIPRRTGRESEATAQVRSTAKIVRTRRGANAKGQKIFARQIWQEYLDLTEELRKTARAIEIYAM